jgi:hypothetical protein
LAPLLRRFREEIFARHKETQVRRPVLAVLVGYVLVPGITLGADSVTGKWKTTDSKTGAVVSEVQLR